MAARRRVQVEVPAPEDDRPKFGRVGLIVISCFLLGVTWPHLAGVTLVQRPPVKAKELRELAETPKWPSGALVAEPSPAEPVVEVAPATVENTPQPALVQVDVAVEKSLVVSCRARGEEAVRREGCDRPKLDSVVLPALEALTQCSGIENAAGRLSIGLDVDFGVGRIVRLVRGKTTTLSQPRSQELLQCLERALKPASLASIEHQHDQYWYFYLVRLAPKQP